MIIGSMIAAVYDISFHALGYTLIGINDLCTAALGVYTKQKLDAKVVVNVVVVVVVVIVHVVVVTVVAVVAVVVDDDHHNFSLLQVVVVLVNVSNSSHPGSRQIRSHVLQLSIHGSPCPSVHNFHRRSR